MAQIIMPQQKKDTLDQLVQGVQLAGGILGIKKDWEQLKQLSVAAEQNKAAEARSAETHKLGVEEMARKKEGRFTPEEMLDANKSFKFSPENVPGSVKVIDPSTGAPVFGIPREAPKDLTSALTAKKFEYEMTKDQKEKDRQERIDADNIVKDFQNDKRTAKYQETYERADSLKQLLSKNSPVIDAIALRNVFGLSGDTGAIRSEDLEQFSVNPSLVGQATSLINKALDGKALLPDERAALFDFAEDMGSNARQDLNRNAESFADRLAKATRMKKNEALEYLNPSLLLRSRSPRNMVNTETKIGAGPAGAAPKKSNEDILNEFISQ